jgi:O-methyltransferase domain
LSKPLSSQDLFDVLRRKYLATHPDEAAIAAAAMTSASSVQLSDILAACDFSHFERIVDVGGGQDRASCCTESSQLTLNCMASSPTAHQF